MEATKIKGLYNEFTNKNKTPQEFVSHIAVD